MNEKGKGKKSQKKAAKPLKPRGEKRGRNNTTSAFQMKREQFATECYALRCLGYSYRQIAEHMGESHAPETFSLGRTYELFQMGRSMRLKEKLEEVLDTHMDRLAILREAVMTAAQAGDVQALDRVIKIDQEERALLGLMPDQSQDEDPKAVLQAKLDAALKRIAPKLTS